MKEAVIFIILNKEETHVLMEERLSHQAYAGDKIYVGGHIDLEDQRDDLEDTRQRTIKREFREELPGMVAHNAQPIPTDPPIYSPRGTRLHPFLIDWSGTVPETVDDQGNPLVWVDIRDASLSPNNSVKELTAALIRFKNYG